MQHQRRQRRDPDHRLPLRHMIAKAERRQDGIEQRQRDYGDLDPIDEEAEDENDAEDQQDHRPWANGHRLQHRRDLGVAAEVAEREGENRRCHDDEEDHGRKARGGGGRFDEKGPRKAPGQRSEQK